MVPNWPGKTVAHFEETVAHLEEATANRSPGR